MAVLRLLPTLPDAQPSNSVTRPRDNFECLSVYYIRTLSRHGFLTNFRQFCNDLSQQDLAFAESENEEEKGYFQV